MSQNLSRSQNQLRQVQRQNIQQQSLMVYIQRINQFQILLAQYRKNQNNTHLNIMKGIKFFMIVIAILISILFVISLNYSSKFSKIQELQTSKFLMQQQIKSLKQTIFKMQEKIQKYRSTVNNLAQQIYNIYSFQLQKQDTNMHILQKYADQYNFKMDNNNIKLSQFKVKQNQDKYLITKKSSHQSIIYSSIPFQKTHSYYLKIKIIRTYNKMISFGVIPGEKKGQQCVYCNTDNMFYLYLKDCQVYNDDFLKIYYFSKKSPKKIQVKQDDIITMFYRSQNHLVSWYLNGIYILSIQIQQKLTENYQFFPFIQMTTAQDKIQILK